MSDDEGHRFDAAVEALAAGRTVVLPTDTVYGLAAKPEVSGATAGLFAAKGRSTDVPVAVLCADVETAIALAAPNPTLERLAAKHWPGALTIVVARRPDLGWELGEPADTIGLRVPGDPLIQHLLARTGPLAVTSANAHGTPTPDNASDAVASLMEAPAVIIDDGPRGGVASTVVAVRGDEIVILRQGIVALDS